MLLITGANGALGSYLRTKIKEPFLALSKNELDISDVNSVKSFFDQHDISSVINCAAYTFVDDAEYHIDLCNKVNIDGVVNLAKTKIPIIQISTDYVFDGVKNSPYQENDHCNPLSIYGRSKFIAEQKLLEYGNKPTIIRVAGLYDDTNRNFVNTIIKLATERTELNVVNDQIMTPTYIADCVDFICNILSSDKNGIYHYSNEGICSWYDFATEIVTQMSLDCKILPIAAKDYKTKAQRPLYSVLDKSKVKKDFGIVVPHWKNSLEFCIESLRKKKNA